MQTHWRSLKLKQIWPALLVVLSTNLTAAQANPSSCVDLFNIDYLSQQAEQFGLKVAIFKEAFRFESRRPSEILKAGGFKPNPAKPEGDILEHVKSRSLGTNNFISFTLDADNRALLGDGFLIEASRSSKFPSVASEQRYLDQFKLENFAVLKAKPGEIELELSQLLGTQYEWGNINTSQNTYYLALSTADRARYNALDNEWLSAHKKVHMLKDGPLPPQVAEFYEYRVKNVRAIETAAIGIEKEKEIVTDNLPAAQITHVRKVSLIFYGGFVGLPSANDQFYGQQLSLLLQDPATAPEIEFGQWRALSPRR